MIRKLIPHICLILTLVFLTLYILNRFNPFIEDTDFYTIVAYLFCGAAVITSGMLIAYTRKS